MRKKRHIELRYIILIIVITIITLFGLFSYIIKTDKKLTLFESLVKDVVVNVQKVFNKPFKGFSTMITDYKDLKNVLEENKKLKSNIDKIASVEAENEELKKEIDDLKKELDIDKVLSDYKYMNATVVSRNTNIWYNLLTIDKGAKNGIKEGMVVVNSTGLIGKITNVSTFSSDVKLITTTDTNNKISVKIVSNGNHLTGLINGYDNKSGYLEVEGISNTDSVNIGDLVYTSGLGGVFPSGILIGKVENITTDVYDLAKIINVKPSADFNDINYVTILQRDEKNVNN